LGVIPTIGPFLLPRALPPLRRAFPRLQLYLTEDLTARLVEQLEAGRLDVLLLALPCDCGGAETLVLAEDLFSVAMRRDHPLSRTTHVAEDRLAGEPVLLLEDGHCLRDHALAACSLTESRDSRAFAATSLYTLVQMVANGLGVTLLPRLAIDAGILKGTDVVARPLLAARPSRQIGLAWRRGTRRRDEFALLGRWLMPKGAGGHKNGGVVQLGADRG
jgi:LysR family hydrogen peroxide-inducible transcriptional activator